MTIQVGGKDEEVGVAVHQLRTKLWNEHVGNELDDPSVADPIAFAQEMHELAKKVPSISFFQA